MSNCQIRFSASYLLSASSRMYAWVILLVCMSLFTSLPIHAAPATAGPYWYCLSGTSPPLCTNGSAPNPSAGFSTVPSQYIPLNLANFVASLETGCPGSPYSVTPPSNWSFVEDIFYSASSGASTDLQTVTATSGIGGLCNPDIPYESGIWSVYRYREFTCPSPYNLGLTGDGGTCSGGIGVSLFDPIADGLESATGIVTSSTKLATASSKVAGVAADRATLVLVQVTGANSGDLIRLTLSDENGPSADGPGAGYLTTLPANGMDSRNSGGIITVNALASGVVNVTYHAPSDFVRSGNSTDPTAIIRHVSIIVSDLSTGEILDPQPISIVRPPVILVHGIWGGPDDFNTAGGVYDTLTNSQLFSAVKFAQYNTRYKYYQAPRRMGQVRFLLAGAI